MNTHNQNQARYTEWHGLRKHLTNSEIKHTTQMIEKPIQFSPYIKVPTKC